MMRGFNIFPPRSPSETNSVTRVVFGVVLLVLGLCGVGYWRYVETETLHLQERNFRALTVTSRALGTMVANCGTALKSVIEGEPSCNDSPCQDKAVRKEAYRKAVQALPDLRDVTIAEETKDIDGFAAKFIYPNGVSSIKLTYVHQDRARPIQTRWKITAVMDIGTIMKQLVTEDIFSDVLLAERTGRVLYHHPSTRDPSGFEFEDVSALLYRGNDSESKNGGAEKDGAGALVSKLPLFNEAPIGGIAHAIFAQAMDLLADPETAQTLILVGIVPAGQFYAEARAIPLNPLLLIAGLLLVLFFVLPYVKLRTNVPTERLTPISIVVLIVFSLLGVAVLTFGLADIATYHNLEQHLDTRLEAVSKEIRKQFKANVELGLQQLDVFDESCNAVSDCRRRLTREPAEPQLAQRLCIGMKTGGQEKGFAFFPTTSDDCSADHNDNRDVQIVYPDVKAVFWVGSSGELKIIRSREPHPWKYVNLQERQYVRRILADETVIREQDGQKFWIEPIFSRTTGGNAAVLSRKSTAFAEGRNPGRPIVAGLEVKLPSVTGAGVPPGLGFAVINQEGDVLFHSDPRRNLRENLFEETDRDGRLRQAVFAHATTQFDGRYWGKDRHFHIAPLFLEAEFIEPSDVYWSLVTYWDTDMLRVLNLRALYSSGVLFFLYAIIALSIGIVGWWMYSRTNEATYRWVSPQSQPLHRYEMAIGLFVVSLGAVGIWYARPHSYSDMLLWGLLPALVAAVVSVTHVNADAIRKDKTDVSARRRYRRFYALVVTLILVAFVMIPALVIFRVAVDVEWRLLTKFAQVDLIRDRAFQAQGVRDFHAPALFHEANHDGEVRTDFLLDFSGLNYVYADFPFQSCWRNSKESENCGSASRPAVQRGDERLIRWLYHIIDRPRFGQSGAETDMFLEEPERWHESERGTLGLIDRSQGTTSPISLYSQIPPAVPQWLYSLLVFGGLVPLVALRVKMTYVFAAVLCALGGSLSFGLVGEALALLGVSALLYGACYVLPTLAARRVLPLDFSRPSSGSTATDAGQGIAEMRQDRQAPSSWPPGLSDVFAKEMSGLRDALRLTGIPWSKELLTSRENMLQQDIEGDFEVAKERLIREVLEAATSQYLQMWEQRTASQRRSLFNLARDGFLHSRNPDIGPLLTNGLIVADLKLRPMNESFRRFIIRTGLEERLDEDIAQARTGAWFQVWRPIGVGLVLIMVFLMLTQEQYRAITLAFLGVLPGLLGAFSQGLTAPKKEKLDTASSA
ncbi:MAG: hypothetical protein P0120_13275 [Nitrospira sp.]|nr:hypothetical protein [Nitrospira sp.]